MNRRTTIVYLAGLIGLLLCSTGSAQYGWNGWRGGANTVGGTRAYGMGNFAAGAGQYNEQTAEARSINTQNAMQLNEYLYQSEQVRQKQYAEKMAGRQARDAQARDQIQDRHLNNPSPSDITSGLALNATYHWLSNPQIPQEVLHSAGADLMLTGDEVRRIPLNSASQGIVISIERLAAEDQWPGSLRGGDFEPLRKKYSDLVQEARSRPDGKPIPDELIDRGITIMQQLRSLAKSELRGPEAIKAENYLKGHVGLLQIARTSDLRDELEKAREIEQVPLSNAIAFLQVHNLQFGEAKDDAERALYLQSLYPKMAEMRARVMQMADGPPPRAGRPRPPHAGRPPAGLPHGDLPRHALGAGDRPARPVEPMTPPSGPTRLARLGPDAETSSPTLGLPPPAFSPPSRRKTTVPSTYIDCPSCGWEGKIDESLLGQRLKCKKCGGSFLAEIGGSYDLQQAGPTTAAAPAAERPARPKPPAPSAAPNERKLIEGEDLDSLLGRWTAD